MKNFPSQAQSALPFVGSGQRKAFLLWCAVALAAAVSAGAQSADAPARNFGDLSIEELMNESVTSVSKKEQRLGDAATAISVLTHDDIRRSGATTVMEALRLVPGVNVGQVNASEWAISVRGFNGVFSSKLLVLIDGRAVYSPLFAGVLWDMQQVMLEDVDRIEVIRGPGAAVWGANAVNGVINVVSRSARETQGGLVYGGGGDQHERLGGVRYGGQVGANTYYRVFASQRSEADFPPINGVPAGDAWRGRHGGFRVDHYPTADTHVTWQADVTDMKHDDGAVNGYDFNMLGRWTHQLSAGSSVEVQAYYDRFSRDAVARSDNRSDTADLTAQHMFWVGPSHNIIWGGGYRHIDNGLAQTTPFIQVRRPHSALNLFSAFLQDEYHVIPDQLTLSVGAKLEHNDYSGWEFQPSIRAAFKPTPKSTLWAAISRAVRTPGAFESQDMIGITVGAPFLGPDGGTYLPTIVGNAHPAAEVLWAYEAGYRAQVSRHVSVDVALYYNDYRDLISNGDIARFVPGAPFGIAEIPFVNLYSAKTYGGAASLTVSPVDTWRLTASYSRLTAQLPEPAVANAFVRASWPKHQAVLRSSHDLTPRTSLDVQLRYVSALPGVAAYTTGDFRVAYRWTERIELSLVGQNVFDPQHPEQAPQLAAVTTETPRQFYGKVTWRF